MTRSSPSEAAVDSQPVEAATMISIDVGYNSIKKIHGRKQHLSVSKEVTLLTQKLLLSCCLSAASLDHQLIKNFIPHCFTTRYSQLLINATQLNTFWWLMEGCTASLHCRLIFPPLLTNGYTSDIIT
ncbi:MAG: hypothetical protein V7L28_03345 [Nostoc sp.]